MLKYPSRRTSHQGFTLIEMVITVAVMAILVGMSMPSIYEWMKTRDRVNENNAMQEIRKAMQAYLIDKGTLPTDNLSAPKKWYEELAGYTNLSQNEIANDVWGRPRSYILYTSPNRVMLGSKVNVYYATIHSKGVDGNAENQAADSAGVMQEVKGIALNGKEFQDSSNANWWKGTTYPTDDAKINTYSALQPGGDDHLLRYTNYPEVMDRYNLTIQRLDRITQALETYARSKYAERVSICTPAPGYTPPAALCDNGLPEKIIYYPRAIPAYNTSGDPAESATLYSSTTTVVDNRTSVSVSDRRDRMKNFVNMLGLPTDYCCSALEAASDGPMPFYYFSNPRPRTSGGCGPRPTADTVKLPARLTTTNYSDSSSDRTCG